MSTDTQTEPAEQPPETTAEPDADDTGNEAVDPTLSAADDEEPEPVVIDHAPPRLSQGIATGAALFGAALTAPFALLALPFGLSGFVIVAASMWVVHSRGWLTVGTGLILLGSIVTGAFGAVAPELMLVAVASTILAWDAGQHGLSIGDQLGRNTKSRRLQVVHTATSAVAIGLVSVVAYAVFLFSGDGRPAPAVALLVVGIVIVAWLFRD